MKCYTTKIESQIPESKSNTINKRICGVTNLPAICHITVGGPKHITLLSFTKYLSSRYSTDSKRHMTDVTPSQKVTKTLRQISSRPDPWDIKERGEYLHSFLTMALAGVLWITSCSGCIKSGRETYTPVPTACKSGWALQMMNVFVLRY